MKHFSKYLVFFELVVFSCISFIPFILSLFCAALSTVGFSAPQTTTEVKKQLDTPSRDSHRKGLVAVSSRVSPQDPLPWESTPISTEGFYTYPNHPRLTVLTLTLKGVDYDYLGDGVFELVGNGVSTSVGFGLLAPKYGLWGEVDFYQGPFENSLGSSWSNHGTGVSLYTVFSLSGKSTRGRFSFGMLAGFNYFDFSLKSVGPSLLQQGPDPFEVKNLGLIDQVKTRINQLQVVVGFGFLKLKSPRPQSNKPEQLTTRTEGYGIFSGVALPVLSSYRARYREKVPSASEPSDLPEGLAENAPKETALYELEKFQSGQPEGFSLFIQWTTFVGI